MNQENIQTLDKSELLYSLSKKILNNEILIGEYVNKINSLTEVKKHYFDIFGDESPEYKLATLLLNIARMGARSLRHQNENASLYVGDWVSKNRIREVYIEKLQKCSIN